MSIDLPTVRPRLGNYIWDYLLNVLKRGILFSMVLYAWRPKGILITILIVTKVFLFGGNEVSNYTIHFDYTKAKVHCWRSKNEIIRSRKER